jgi:hypothetical protein
LDVNSAERAFPSPAKEHPTATRLPASQRTREELRSLIEGWLSTAKDELIKLATRLEEALGGETGDVGRPGLICAWRRARTGLPQWVPDRSFEDGRGAHGLFGAANSPARRAVALGNPGAPSVVVGVRHGHCRHLALGLERRFPCRAPAEGRGRQDEQTAGRVASLSALHSAASAPIAGAYLFP